VVSVKSCRSQISIAMNRFWENFPKAIDVHNGALSVRLFPKQSVGLHEIQGGEQKTEEFVIAFGADRVTADTLEWVRQPLLLSASPEYYASTQAIPYVSPRSEDTNADYLQLVDAAITGDDTFAGKREVIDEYGWRHFGEIYGDHEAVRRDTLTPLVSHYNNQYDPIAGFAYQFLRSGDSRWWTAMSELAAHVVDIDIYHTSEDKPGYNHGLFWHTCHYVDADTATHRSYPRRAADLVGGGGPSCEHVYTTGLMLHFFLTGNPSSREAAIGLARSTLEFDDGSKSPFRWLSRGNTGWASASGSFDYHGPGRGPGNAINALLDAHRLTSDRAFLAKAEQLVRRCIHPADDIDARELLDAERRWYYTVFLQALGKYLDYKCDRAELDDAFAYARASLLHYARWMAKYEHPILETPEKLEFPTETWAAQDMRKSEVFKYAAKYADAGERTLFLDRSEFFFRYSTRTLRAMATRTLARPVVILLSYGFMHAYFQAHPDCSGPPQPLFATDFGRPELFIPQKTRAIRAVAIASAIAIGALAAVSFFFLIR